MKMFLWESEVFRGTGTGYVAVMADNEDQARKKAKKRVRKAAMDPNWGGAREFGNTCGTDEFTNDDWNYFKAKMEIFDHDLAKAPVVVSKNCLFIYGEV